MKNYLILSLAALAALVSCQKENLQNDTVSNEPLVFTASIAQDDTKATVDIAGSSAKILWESNDKITITDGSSHVAVYKVSTGAGTKTATFVKDSGDDLDSPGTYTATFGEAPSTTLSQPYSGTSVPVYMTAPSTSDPDNLCFTVQGGVLKLTLTKSGEQARMIVISNASSSYTLACTSPVDLSSGTTFYMNLPAGTYTRMAVYDGNCQVAERTGLNMVIKENTLLPASTSDLTFNTIPGALPGVFTVNSSGKKVHFSKGNLQAKYSTGTSKYSWSFATNQYNYVGKAAGNTTIDSQTDNAVVDLFGWSTAATNYGISTSKVLADYPGDFVDWGTTIGDVGVWRTLSTEELQYLFSTRGTGDTYFKIGVTVCGKANCLVIAPDGNTVNINNVYTIDGAGGTAKWSDAEALDFVCLPAAGYRDGGSVSNVGKYGRYWTSSPTTEESATSLYFTDPSITNPLRPSFGASRYNGYSVRLVAE